MRQSSAKTVKKPQLLVLICIRFHGCILTFPVLHYVPSNKFSSKIQIKLENPTGTVCSLVLLSNWDPGKPMAVSERVLVAPRIIESNSWKKWQNYPILIFGDNSVGDINVLVCIQPTPLCYIFFHWFCMLHVVKMNTTIIYILWRICPSLLNIEFQEMISFLNTLKAHCDNFVGWEYADKEFIVLLSSKLYLGTVIIDFLLSGGSAESALDIRGAIGMKKRLISTALE